MKFRNLGRVCLALAASLVLIGGMDSCVYDYTVAYVFVTGSQYNQISSYREDNNTGQLRPSPGNPLSTEGYDPIRATLLAGGRYVYVLNHGKPTMAPDGSETWSGEGISVFSVGGDGSLAFEQSYPSIGNGPVRIALSADDSFLYVLDEYEPTSTPGFTPASTTSTPANPCYDATSNVWRPVGDVTVFSIDKNTGRLYLVPNQETQNASGANLTYFPLGCGPIDFHENSGFLYTAENNDPNNPSTLGQVVYAYQVQGTTGQLLQAPGGSQVLPGTKDITVIGASQSGSWIYVLDSGTNTIYTFTAGSNGLLSAGVGASTANEAGTSGMTALTTDSTSHWLYIANSQSPALGYSGSQISAFIINPSSGVLQFNSEQPYVTGAGPVCIFEDPSHQYVYTANADSSTVTGSKINTETGILGNLSRGSQFPTVGTPTWCLYSANTD